MILEEIVSKIFDVAQEKGLKNVEIRINAKDETNPVTLWVGDKDRFACNSLAKLEESLTDHEDLSWMN